MLSDNIREYTDNYDAEGFENYYAQHCASCGKFGWYSDVSNCKVCKKRLEKVRAAYSKMPKRLYLKSGDPHVVVNALVDGKWVDLPSVLDALHMAYLEALKCFDVRPKPENNSKLYNGPSDMMLRIKPRSED